MALIGGVININNSEVSFIKARIDSNLNIVLKKILDKLNMTQQEFIDKKIKEFVIENVHLIVSNYLMLLFKKHSTHISKEL